MNFQELDTLIANSGRRSIASSLLACLLDASDSGSKGLDLDDFQSRTGFIRNNITSVASYLQRHELIIILYYRDTTEERDYVSSNSFGRWAKQHYQLTQTLKGLFHRS